MPGIVGRLFQGASRAIDLAAFFDEGTDPWGRMRFDCPPNTFGQGSRRAFAEYFRGESRVMVQSLDEVCAWLRGCECLSDDVLFLESDYWQHPVTFEHLRKGDCEDHALWAWRKLRELGLESMFVAGRWRERGHVWLLLDGGPELRLVETTAKDRSMVVPFERVRSEYVPALGVDSRLRTWVYRGYRHFHGASR